MSRRSSALADLVQLHFGDCDHVLDGRAAHASNGLLSDQSLGWCQKARHEVPVEPWCNVAERS